MDRGVDKGTARRWALAARSAAGRETLARGDEARTRALLATPGVAAATCLTCYLSAGTEPDTRVLIEALLARGAEVLLPRLRPDGGLDLVVDDGTRVAGLRGTLEPSGPTAERLPEVWLVPALGVDRSGVRLGRGGGAYDRVLPRGATAIALLHDGELVDALPREAHDRPVTHVALPGGVVAVGRP